MYQTRELSIGFRSPTSGALSAGLERGRVAINRRQVLGL